MSSSNSVGTVVPSRSARYLDVTLASLLAQTVRHEIVVVDDGSPDSEVSEVAREFGVRSIRNESTAGAANARNLGISGLETRWIVNFDEDNIAEPRFVEALLGAALRRRRVGIAYCRARQFGDSTGPYWPVRRGLPWHLKVENFVDANSLFARAAWEEAGGFDPRAVVLQDWDLWLGIVERGWRLAFVPEYLFRYRVRAGGARLSATEPTLRAAREYVLRKHASFVARRHRLHPGNQVARLTNRVRRWADRRSVAGEVRGPASVLLVGSGEDETVRAVAGVVQEAPGLEAVGIVGGEPGGRSSPSLPAIGPATLLKRSLDAGARGAVISAGNPRMREDLGAAALEAGLELPVVIHPRCYLAPGVDVGAGSIVGVLAVVGTGAQVGRLVLVSPTAYIGDHVRIGDCSILHPGARVGSGARVGGRAVLGMGSVILPGVTIGDDAAVDAGSVVMEDVPPYTTVAGAPATVVT